MNDYPIYSQRDPRWATRHYGLPQAAQTSTIGTFGCAITAIAQKLTLKDRPCTPEDIQARMLLMNCFQNWGSYNHVNWARLPIAFPNLHFNGRYDAIAGHPTLPRTMNMIHDRLSANDPVVVYVDASKRALGLQQHFVLAIGERPNGRIEILNPWGGLRQDLSAYDSPDNNAIRGAIWLDWVAEVKGMAV